MIGAASHFFCIPLVASTCAEVERVVRDHGHEARFIEVWLDYRGDRSIERITAWARKHPGRFVFHFRRRNGESIAAPYEERLTVWRALASHDVWIDLDGESQALEIEVVRALCPHARGIVSHHNFTATPALAELRAVVRRLHAAWPEAVVKIAAACRSSEDAAAVSALERELSDEAIPHIVLGMGEAGRETRIAGALGGNVMNFTPLEVGASTAAGQIPLDDFRAILEARLAGGAGARR